MNTMPVIRIELEGMRQVMQLAMVEHLLKMDEDIQSAIDSVCTPANIKRIIQESADKEIERALKSEIEKFYVYGDGKRAIAAAVASSLKEREERGW